MTTGLATGGATAAVINFDDLSAPGPGTAGLTVNVQYSGQGVTFNDPSAFDYSAGPLAIPNFAHSPEVAVEPCVATEFCTTPVRASFTAGQEYVRVWVGFSVPLPSPIAVRLTGFDASSALVGTADGVLPANPAPTPIGVPLEITRPSPDIRSIEVSVTTGGGYTSGLAVDDVEFSTVGPPPPCTAVGPPTVTLSAPADGLVTDDDSFQLQGSIAANGAPITDANVVAVSPAPRSASIYPSLVSANGGPFGPTSLSGTLSLGVNDVSVTATNCRGTGTSSARRVTRTIPQPGPHPAACVPQPDHPEIHFATSANDLSTVLTSGFQGQVIVPKGARYDMTGFHGAEGIVLRSGVQLVGERGELGRRPLLYSDDLDTYAMFAIRNPDVCVEGLRLAGPSGSPRKAEIDPFAIKVSEDPALFAGDPEPVVIADNEISGWPGGAVEAHGTVVFPDREGPKGYDGPRITRETASKVRVERNYIHDNAKDGGGYGLAVGGSAYATATGNVFEFNRHAVTSGGHAFSGYFARFNYILEGGYKYGDGYYGAHFDVHGTHDPGHWVGGEAGEYHEILNNTVRGEQEYHCFQGHFCDVRPALALRGRPSDGVDFIGNVVAQDSDDAVKLRAGDDGRLNAQHPGTFRLHSRGNDYDADYSKEVAAGDFDGDGRTDVFLANGTGWFFSRAGVRPWEFLRPSNKRVRKLAFADIDNDGATDVVYRDPAGAVGYVKSGAAAQLTPLTSAPVPIGELRFGDFDGDRLTDIFYTRNRQWRVWYGSTRTWTPTQTSSQPISGLLFGEFDDVRGTDVAAVARNEWSYSSGSTQRWKRLNAKVAPSFSAAVAADFDGDGKTDIAIGDARVWRYSRGGRSSLRTLRRDSQAVGSPNRLLVGNFDARGQLDVVGFGPDDPKRLIIWRGLGSPGSFTRLSEQNMR